jgi:hypothetical protein
LDVSGNGTGGTVGAGRGLFSKYGNIPIEHLRFVPYNSGALHSLRRGNQVRHSTTNTLLKWASVSAFTCASIWGQTITNGGLKYSQTVGMPNWGNSGATQANYDLFAFNPRTRIMYVADRLNKGISAIDTRSNVTIGYMLMPNNSSPNGVLVAPDLQKLCVTDAGKSLWVWDLRLPGLAPQQYLLPNVGGNTDAFDYDLYNKTVYLINGTAPYYMSGVNLVTGAITQMQLPWSPELTRFNTVDGLIYQVITDGDNKNAAAGMVAYDPVANKIVSTVLTPNCVPHGIDIDPVSNVALLGCGTNQGQIMINLKDGTIMKQFSDVTGTDLLVFNPNNRRFYTGSAGNVATTSGCSPDSTKNTPVIGIFDALMTGGVPVPRLVGVACAGRNAKVGVDPIENVLYVPVRQYPADPNSATTGQTGVSVYIDTAPAAQPLTAKTQSVLKSLAASTAQATVNTAIDGRVVRIDASPTGVTGKTALLVFSTTVGYESVDCAVDNASSKAICGGDLVGDPMIGSMVTLAVDGVPVARGPVAAAQ